MVQNVEHANETGGRIGGLMEGIEAGAGDDAVVSKRVEIGGEKPSRRPVDAGWSKKKKQTVAAVAVVLTVAALGVGGWLMIAQRSIGLPRSAEEAVRVMSSARYDNLSDERRLQYAAEAARLMGERDPAEVAGMLGDDPDQVRRVMREMGFAQLQSSAVGMAQTGEMPDLIAMFSFMRQMSEAMSEREGPDFESMTEEEREAFREERRAEMQERIQNSIESGNAQNMVLMRQMFQSMRASGQGGGGGRGFGRMFGGRGGGGGGSPRGGGGGGGGGPRGGGG